MTRKQPGGASKKGGAEATALPEGVAFRMTVDKPWRNLRKGESFDFHAGVNLIVGDQGSGKTSLLQMLGCIDDWRLHTPADFRSYRRVVVARPYKLLYFDFYRHHPSNHGGGMPETPGGIVAMMNASTASHGETVRLIHSDIRRGVEKILGKAGKGDGVAFILDEPCSGASPRTLHTLQRELAALSSEYGHRVAFIVSTHSPVLIEGQAEVLDMERRRWTRSDAFLERQAQPWVKPKWMEKPAKAEPPKRRSAGR